jgi:hypothetical protein
VRRTQSLSVLCAVTIRSVPLFAFYRYGKRNASLQREVGFLKEKRRLNVAMTRAKRSLCVVGDSETVRHGSSYLKRWMAWLEANADVRFAGVE